VTDVEPYRAGAVDLQAVKDILAPDASDLDLKLFGLVCRHLDLDPFAGHIYLIGRKQKVKDGQGREIWKIIYKPQIAVAGRRAIAARTGRLQGVEGPDWCAARRYTDAGEKLPLDWLEVWDDDDQPPYAARCRVHVAGWKVPANGTVKYSEFAQYANKERTELSPFWERSPAHMLGKVAEALALRRGFPEVEAAISYVDTRGLEADDAAILAEAEASGPAPLVPRGVPGAGPDQPPASYYDDLPEARGYLPDTRPLP
jgi:RecT family